MYRVFYTHNYIGDCILIVVTPNNTVEVILYVCHQHNYGSVGYVAHSNIELNRHCPEHVNISKGSV